MKLRAIYSSSLHVPVNNSANIDTVRPKREFSSYHSNSYTDESPFQPKPECKKKKKKIGIKEGFNINLLKKKT